jgi:hypothetical protein
LAEANGNEKFILFLNSFLEQEANQIAAFSPGFPTERLTWFDFRGYRPDVPMGRKTAIIVP